jgi:hypothetical protein
MAAKVERIEVVERKVQGDEAGVIAELDSADQIVPLRALRNANRAALLSTGQLDARGSLIHAILR